MKFTFVESQSVDSQGNIILLNIDDVYIWSPSVDSQGNILLLDTYDIYICSIPMCRFSGQYNIIKYLWSLDFQGPQG